MYFNGECENKKRFAQWISYLHRVFRYNEIISTPEHLNKNSGKLSGKWILNTSDLLLGSRNQQICQRLYTMLNTAKHFEIETDITRWIACQICN